MSSVHNGVLKGHLSWGSGMQDRSKLYSEFISLGDNCEFGFVQRAANVETGSLLRWARLEPNHLLVALRNRFANLYEFVNLEPFAPNMVLDTKTNIAFHSEMHSKLIGGHLKFEKSDDDRMPIFNDEVSKIRYLKDKLISELERGDKIFVFKSNNSLQLSDITALYDAIISYNSNNVLLYVTDDREFGLISLKRLYNNLYIGLVDKLAPYEQAERISEIAWNKLICDLVMLQPLASADANRLESAVDLIRHQTTTWSRGIAQELWFWSRWFSTQGLDWKYDFEERQNPNALLNPALVKLLPSRDAGIVRILDVGAGPLTNIGFCHEGTSLEIQACDPLAEYYATLCRRAGVTPPVHTTFAVAEDLSTYFNLEYFDIINCCNALDHSADPIRGLVEMLRILKVGGYVFLKHHLNEAETESYSGFHQYNFDSRDGRFVIWNKNAIFDVENVLPIGVQIKTDIETPDIIVTIKKLGAFDRVEHAASVIERLKTTQMAFVRHGIFEAAKLLEVNLTTD